MILRALATLQAKRLWKAFEAATRNPAETQKQLLLRLVGENAATVFGQEHGFATIRSVADYQKQVPIRDFSGLSPWIDRIADGQKAILTREPIIFFNQSSGTSGKPKLIPVNQSWISDTGRLRRIWGGLAMAAQPKLMSGKSISIVYAASGGRTSGGIEYGSLSGRVFLQSPFLLRRRYAIPYEVARISDPPSKQYVSMRVAIAQDVTFFFSTNAATVLAMVETAEARREELLRDLHDGTLTSGLDLPQGVREGLKPWLKPNPAVARSLEKIAAKDGRLRPKDYWPNAALLGCWLGSTVGMAASRLPEWFAPSLVVRDVGLAASEGVFSLPVENGVPYGPLTVDSNFYEFIPADETVSTSSNALTVEQLEDGHEYYIIVTNCAGLYRYHIKDVVRVVGRFNGTPMIQFVRKGSDTTNLVGEKMDISYVIDTIRALREEDRIPVLEFRVQADMERLLYRFHLELEEPVRDTRTLAETLEGRLLQLNPFYAKWIKEKQLNPLEVRIMKPGWFQRYVDRALANGGRHGQFKPALLTTKGEPEDEVWVQE